MERRVALVVEHDRSTGELISLLPRERGYGTSVAITHEQARTPSISDAAEALGVPLVAKPFATDDLLAQVE